MQISLRSQLVAGVAALGATAIAITPITQPDLLPSLQRVSADVQLVVANPINAIGGVIQDVNTDIFNQAFIDSYTWPDFFFGTDDYFYGPNYNGLLPDLVNLFSSGPLSALINNVSGYAWAGIRGVGVIGSGTAAALFNTPGALIGAAQELIVNQDLDAALAILQTQILGPLQLGITGAVEATGYIIDNVIDNAQTVLTSTLPFVVSELLGVATGGLSFMANSVINTVGTIITNLATFSLAGLEGAWNAAVNGFLGREGLLGQIEQLTLGLGIVRVVGGENEVVVPSVRSVITSELQRLGDFKVIGDGGILNEPFDAPPAPPPGAADRAPALAAAPAAVEAAPTQAPAESAATVEPSVTSARADASSDEGPSAAVTATSATQAASAGGGTPTTEPAEEAAATTEAATETASTVADGGATSAEKPAKHRVSRKAAKAAADN